MFGSCPGSVSARVVDDTMFLWVQTWSLRCAVIDQHGHLERPAERPDAHDSALAGIFADCDIGRLDVERPALLIRREQIDGELFLCVDGDAGRDETDEKPCTAHGGKSTAPG